jgi:hypothetical protein
MAALPAACSKLLRRHLPSTGTNLPEVASLSPALQRAKHRPNCSGSMRRNRRLKVSCDGIPFGSQKRAQPGLLGLAEFFDTYPAIRTTDDRAHKAMTSISWKGWRMLRRRGSRNSEKCSKIVSGFGIGDSLDTRRPPDYFLYITMATHF